ncbi:MAG: spermidine/putrescine ABC transporter substrate-binding protein [Clostridia bacterium]|nr:spermidine/putrescine ABC transporter substrate-binding protein [Clostridia bacterium]
MKKVRWICLLLMISLLCAASALLLSACKKQDVVVLNVYNWGEYISDGADDTMNVNAEFEKYFNENLSEKYGYKVRVNYTTYSSNEEMYAKLKNTDTPYDVLIPSDYLVALLIREGMLHKLNFDNIPNFSYIDRAYIDGNYYDVTNEYSIPYTMGKVGLIYNTKYIEDEIDSWSALWNEKYKEAGILQFNNSRDAFGTAQFLLGINVNSTDKSDWDRAAAKLAEQKPLIQKYVMDEVFNKMESGNASLAPYYAGDFFTMYASNEDLAFAYPKEGSNVFCDAMCIPTCSQNKELAELYINFLLEPEVAIANAEYICYASPHTGVFNDPDYIAYMNEEVHSDAYDILYNDFEKDFKNQGFAALDTEMQEHLNALWDELKISSETSTYVYVLSATILAVLIFSIAFYIIRKKRREMTY